METDGPREWQRPAVVIDNRAEKLRSILILSIGRRFSRLSSWLENAPPGQSRIDDGQVLSPSPLAAAKRHQPHGRA